MVLKHKTIYWWASCLLVLFFCLPACQPAAKSDKDKGPLPAQAMEHFRQAHKFWSEQKPDEALKEFQETVRLAPDSPLAYFWLGKIYFLRQNKDEAEKNLKKVLELDNKNYHSMALLGRLYSFDKAKLDEAQKYLTQSLEASPDNLEAHFDLGRVYAMKGDRERATREFAFTLSKEADFAVYHFEVGRVMEAWGNRDAAMGHFKRALVLNPKLTVATQAIERLEKAPKEAPKAPTGPAPAPPAAPPPGKKGAK